MRLRVVTASYKDAALLQTWIPKLNVPYLIYHKDDQLSKNEERKVDDSNIFIPNYGRCDYAFLYHIIQNYDQLDDVTLFVKNNWEMYGINLWGHVNNCTNYDYMESGTLIRYQYWKDLPANVPRHELLYSNKHLFTETAFDWYHQIFPGIEPPHIVVGWGHGPCFSVSRELIRRHPKSVYVRLLEKFYPESGSWNIEIGNKYFPDPIKQLEDVGKHYHDCFQRFWFLLFTHNTDPAKFKIFK